MDYLLTIIVAIQKTTKRIILKLKNLFQLLNIHKKNFKKPVNVNWNYLEKESSLVKTVIIEDPIQNKIPKQFIINYN